MTESVVSIQRERDAFGSFNNRYGYDSLTFEGMHVCSSKDTVFKLI